VGFLGSLGDIREGEEGGREGEGEEGGDAAKRRGGSSWPSLAPRRRAPPPPYLYANELHFAILMFHPSRPARKGARIRGKGFVLPFVRVYVYDRFARTNGGGDGDGDDDGGGGGGGGLETPKITGISAVRPDDARFSSLSMATTAYTRTSTANEKTNRQTKKERDREVGGQPRQPRHKDVTRAIVPVDSFRVIAIGNS